MRLGLIRYKYSSTGGAEKTLAMLAGGLLARGHEVHAVVSRWQGEPPAGLELHELGVKPGEFAPAALAAMASLKPDTFLSLDRVAHCPMIRAGDGCHRAWLERRAPHEKAFKRLLLKLEPRHRALLDLERRMFQAPELRLVIANSKLVADELEKYYGLGPERVVVVYNGIRQAEFSKALDPHLRGETRIELGLDQKQPVFLFLGSGFERKGLAYAIKALARLGQGLLLVAGRDRTATYQSLAGRLGLKERVVFLGERTDAPRLMAAADALLLPTVYDPCANSCLEALAAGLPVVTTTANGAAELVDKDVNGQVVESPQDADALAQACEKALGLGRPVSHRVESVESWLERMTQIMESVAGGGGA